MWPLPNTRGLYTCKRSVKLLKYARYDFMCWFLLSCQTLVPHALYSVLILVDRDAAAVKVDRDVSVPVSKWLCASRSQIVSERVCVKRFSSSLFWCSVKSWRLWELCRSTSTRRSSPETSTAPSHTSTATTFTSDRSFIQYFHHLTTD